MFYIIHSYSFQWGHIFSPAFTSLLKLEFQVVFLSIFFLAILTHLCLQINFLIISSVSRESLRFLLLLLFDLCKFVISTLTHIFSKNIVCFHFLYLIFVFWKWSIIFHIYVLNILVKVPIRDLVGFFGYCKFSHFFHCIF